MKSARSFVVFAWINLVYLVGVILFGAWVRITGSGAGCGSHWPTCHGEIIPRSTDLETLIEFTHRVTSGLCGPLGLAMIIWAAAVFGWRHRVFWATVVTLVFVILEALIGAGIVLAELVQDDDSVARAVVVALHLVNTLALTSSTVMAAYWGGGGRGPYWSKVRGVIRWLLLLGVSGFVVTCMSGAITALGDTLFPIEPALGSGLLDKVSGELSSTNHFLVRLRILHPIVSVGLAVFLLVVGDRVRARLKGQPAARWAGWMMWMVCLQVVLGIVNIMLAAPGWMQLVHLLAANILWVTLLMTCAHVLSGSRAALEAES